MEVYRHIASARTIAVPHHQEVATAWKDTNLELDVPPSDGADSTPFASTDKNNASSDHLLSIHPLFRTHDDQ